MRHVVWAVALFCFFVAATAAADEVPRKSFIVGFADFKSEVGAAPSPDEQFVIDYLRRVAEAAPAQAMFATHFEYVRGNYYQILEWMWDGRIDAAVVSPFMLNVLKINDRNTFEPVVEFRARGLGDQLDGNLPVFRAVTNGRAESDPDAALADCLTAQPGECEFRFVTHVSTTGFAQPLMRIRQEAARRNIKLTAQRWDDILKRSRFLLGRKSSDLPFARRIIEFSYAAKERGSADWRPLFPDEADFANDVLVLNRATPRMEGWDSTLLKLMQAIAKKKNRPTASASGYVQFGEVNTEAIARFNGRVAALFQDPWLKERDQLWYHEGKYEFSVAEIVDIIRHDQRLRGESGKHAAIVLPGGGVRGAYQAGILDALYDSHAVNDGFLRDSRLKDTMRLPIKTIVGTSGGALMGYLAARRSPWDTGVLTAPWPSVRPEHVFPPFGALRWLTIVVSVLILGVIAVFTGPKRPIAVPDNPRWLSFALAALVIAAPWLIWRLSMRDPAYFPKYEGMVFGVLVLAVHCIHTVLAPRKLSDGSKLARRKTDLVTGSLAAVAAIGLILRVSLIEWNWTAGADKDSTTFVEPLLAGVAIALGLAAILLFARWDSIRIDRPTVVDYGIGMVVLCLFIALTSALFAIVWWFDRVTVLELTGDYWRAAIAATVIASAVIVLAAHQVPFIGRGLSFLTRRFDREAFAYSPVGTLVIGGFVAFLAWTMLVAPAVYTGEYGANTFRKQAATVGPERARFVAAITTFGTLRMNERNRFAAGDYYAYERNGRPLGRADERFVDFPTKAGDGESDFLDAVNASGSPFPIYPGRYLRTYRGEEIFLDGGYTHLVPIEGAVLLGAKQILVVSNIAWRDKHVHPQTRRFFGMLVTDLLRTVSFLFDRSQQTDLTVQNDVLVATIAPTWPDEDPFLMDFRPTKIQELIAAAKRDADTGRPARVAKWGPPTIFLTVKD